MFSTTLDFYLRTRAQFPQLAQRADREYLKYWGEEPLPEESSYSWFGSVANVLNKEMCGRILEPESAAFFVYVTSVLLQCGDEVANCIDVSLVENLFWQVPARKTIPYWNILPPPLQELYLGFHGRPPFP
jgi:hypothetical protein